MPNEIYWEKDDPQILRIHFRGKVTWQEYEEMLDDVEEEIADIQSPIYLIMSTESPPPAGNPITHIRRALDLFSKNEHVRLVMNIDNGMNEFTRRMINMVGKMYNLIGVNKTRMVESLDKARQLIEAEKSKAKSN